MPNVSMDVFDRVEELAGDRKGGEFGRLALPHPPPACPMPKEGDGNLLNLEAGEAEAVDNALGVMVQPSPCFALWFCSVALDLMDLMDDIDDNDERELRFAVGDAMDPDGDAWPFVDPRLSNVAKYFFTLSSSSVSN